jgi:hypothetical protein
MMRNWLGKILQELRKRVEERRKLSSGNFRRMVDDIRQMADVSGRLWIQDSDFQERVNKIQAEMDQLDNLLAKRSFQTLSREKKQQLHKSLQVSREELIKSIRSAPCPTDRIQ